MTAIAYDGNAVDNVTVEGGDLTITQTVNHYEISPALDVPKELPRPTEVFDRKKETNCFREAVERGVDVVFVNGAPGIGKTTCLVKWANLLKESYPDGQLFIDASQYREHGVSLPQALQVRAAAACGCGAAQLRNCADPGALYRSLTAEKRMLVVIDNVIDKMEIEALIPNSSESLVMVAGQMSAVFPLHGMPIEIGRFADLDSIEFMRAVVARSGGETMWEAFPPDELMKIVSKSDGVPLVLQQAALLLSEGIYAPEDIAEKMDRDPGLGALSPLLDACVDELGERAGLAYRFLGIINAEDAWSAPVENAFRTLGQGEPTDLIALLKRRSLIDFERSSSLGSSGTRVKMHRQIRHHARSLALGNPAGLCEAIGAYVGFYRRFVQEIDYAQSPDRLRLFEREPGAADAPEVLPENANRLFLDHFNEFFGVVSTAIDYGLFEDAGAIAESLWVFYYENGMLRRGLPVFEEGLRASRCLGNRDAEARMLALVSRCHLLFGDSAQAEREMELAHQAAGDSANCVLKGSLCEFSGNIARFKEDYQSALAWYARANEEYLKTGDEDHRGIAISELSSAQCHLLDGDPQAALGVLRRLESRLGTGIDVVTLVKVLICKAEALEARGMHAEALGVLDDAVEKCGANGLTSRGGAARMLSARICRAIGDCDAAARDYLEAADFYSRAGMLREVECAKAEAALRRG